MPELTWPLKLEATASAIKTILGAVTGVTKAYEYDPIGEPLAPPVVTVGLPKIERPGIDEPQVEIGTQTLLTTWPVTVYVKIEKPQPTTITVHRLIGRIMKAIEDNPSLNGEADEAKLVEVNPGENDEQAENRQYVMRCLLEARLLLP